MTGASRGIGRQTALALARAGYDVAFTARTLREGEGAVPKRQGHDDAGTLPVEGSLEQTERMLQEAGAQALPVRMDLLDEDSVRAAAATVLDAWGGVDLLVNNAITHLGGGHDRLLELDLALTARTLLGNFVHQVLLTQLLLPSMVARGGGTVVDMASGSATTDPPAAPGEGGWGLAYAASKAAFGRLAGSVNAEYRAHGVRAFNLDPGFVVTESMAARGGSAAIADAGFDAVPDSTAGAAVVWLATDPGADRFLGKVVWAPKLVKELGLTA